MTLPFIHHLQTSFPEVFTSKILIALSGGVDSVVLTDLCVKAGLDVSLAHCNFNLRGSESKGDERFIAEMADSLQLELFVEQFDTAVFAKEQKVSIQMAARELRYRWFDELRHSYAFDFIFTAHHANDNLETFLINLVRGTGLDGLTGIPERNGFVLRPLLCFSRKEIEDFAQSSGLSWREDSSNISDKYVRNQVRMEVIPKLMQMNPHLMESFNNTLAHLQQSSGLIEDYISALFSKIATKESFGYSFSIPSLESIPNLKGVLYELFKSFGFTQWRDIHSLLGAQPGKVVYSKTHRLIKDRDRLLLTVLEEKQEEAPIVVEEGKKAVAFPMGQLLFEQVFRIAEKGPFSVYIDKGRLEFPLTLRKWKHGDFFYPSGMKGKKKLSKFFKDNKLSLPEKEACWLLCSGDDIVWVIGYRADERFTADETCASILKIHFL